MSGAKRTDNITKSDRSITLRLPEVLLTKINENWGNMGFANRTDLVETACEWYFDTNECPRCKAHNPKNGVRCAVCGEELKPYFKAFSELENIYSEMLAKHDKIVNVLEKQDRQRDKIHNIIESINQEHVDIDIIMHMLSYLMTEREEIGFIIGIMDETPLNYKSRRLDEMVSSAIDILNPQSDPALENRFISLPRIESAIVDVKNASWYLDSWLERLESVTRMYNLIEKAFGKYQSCTI